MSYGGGCWLKMTAITSSFRTYPWKFRRVRNSGLSGVMSDFLEILVFGPLLAATPPDANFVTAV